jgi:hypothetical protein
MEKRRSYELEEARALLPQIRAIILQLAVQRRRYADAHEAVHGELRENGDPQHADELRRLEATTAELRAGIRSLLEHLEALGVQLRDLDEGLVDIPTRRDGRPAWFCWRLSDPELAYWHTPREGFANRRPL